MLFTNVILAGLAAFATATPVAVNGTGDDIKPWEITNFNARKYHPKSHTAWINITLSEPNEIKLQKVSHGYAALPKFQANCYWTWDWFDDPFPLDIEKLCTPVGSDNIYGNLTMKIRPNDVEGELSPGTLDVEIIESRSVTVIGTQYIRVWEGVVKFRSGDNVRLRCSASGVCGWNLQGNPVVINQELTKSVGG